MLAANQALLRGNVDPNPEAARSAGTSVPAGFDATKLSLSNRQTCDHESSSRQASIFTTLTHGDRQIWHKSSTIFEDRRCVESGTWHSCSLSGDRLTLTVVEESHDESGGTLGQSTTHTFSTVDLYKKTC